MREWAQGRILQRWSQFDTAIGLERDGELIAAAGYTDYIPLGSISGHIVIAGPLTREFLSAILWYPFGQLQVRRLSALIPAKHERVRRFVEHIGFTFETRCERVFPDDDLLVYRMFREDWNGQKFRPSTAS